MTNPTTLYNSLPSLKEAEKQFVNRDQIFSKLAPLLAAYGNRFGACIVHRHCTLEEGEMMVATENISQPERNVACYPDRWLATGEPYEYHRKPAPSPPQGLFEEFQKIVDGMQCLGLFFVRDEGEGGVSLERTEGRKNIVEIVEASTPRKSITTAWRLQSGTSHLYECNECIESGGSHVENADKMTELEQRSDIGHEISENVVY